MPKKRSGTQKMRPGMQGIGVEKASFEENPSIRGRGSAAAPMRPGRIFIGTSGWMYKDWGKKFYPKELKKGHLTYLAREFDTVEVNSSFYNLPLASTFAKWHSEVPDDFVFAVKMSRYVTHRKRLVAVAEPIATFISRAKRLNEKLGPILVQLPPSLKYDAALLDALLRILARKHARFALEPRHASWFDVLNIASIRATLRKARIALVFPHSTRIPAPDPDDADNLTSTFVYVRFHGPSEFAASRYGSRRLKPWADRMRQWSGSGLDVYAYFNNDIHGYAIDDARTLKLHLGIA